MFTNLGFILIKKGNQGRVLMRSMLFKTLLWLLAKNGLQQGEEWEREASGKAAADLDKRQW